MSSPQKQSQSTKDKSLDVDVEMEVSASIVNKSDAMDVSEKSDGHNTSGTSVEKKVSKKKKIKSSPTGQSHKKMKKDPNKPEYPKVGKHRTFSIGSFERSELYWSSHCNGARNWIEDIDKIERKYWIFLSIKREIYANICGCFEQATFGTWMWDVRNCAKSPLTCTIWMWQRKLARNGCQWAMKLSNRTWMPQFRIKSG